MINPYAKPQVFDLTKETERDLMAELNQNVIMCIALLMNLNATVKH